MNPMAVCGMWWLVKALVLKFPMNLRISCICSLLEMLLYVLGNVREIIMKINILSISFIVTNMTRLIECTVSPNLEIHNKTGKFWS